MTARLSFVRAQRRGSHVELILRAQVGGTSREVSVLMSRLRGRPLAHFPHPETEAGETLGSDEDDEAAMAWAYRWVALGEARELYRDAEGEERR